jgi:alkaline phosphatase
MLGVDADGKACGTIVEAAQRTGRKIGVVATAPITAPIPASFLSHSTDRNAYSFIGEQILEKELDVAFTGGQKYFHANNGTLLNSAIAKKFTVVQDVASFRNSA